MTTAPDEFSKLFDHNDKREFAKKLFDIIQKKKNGGVIAIDANWGQGKSYFCDKFVELLKEKKKIPSIKIDTFSSDYFEDPFALIAASISTLMNDTEKQEFKTNALKVMKLYAPKLLGAMGGILTQAILNHLKVDKESISKISDAFQESNEQLFSEAIDEYTHAVEIVSDFKNKLKEFAQKQTDELVVIFIDELDRCKPDFALKFIERIKHLFDVKNVIFVLMINRQQIEHYIDKIYHVSTEEQQQEYLYKFVDIFLELPSSATIENIHHSDILKFCTDICHVNNIPNNNKHLFF